MQNDEMKDSRLKYLEMPKQFQGKASEISLNCKQHIRVCQQLAIRLSKEKPKTSQEFERNEYLKDFVIKSSQLNENVLTLLDYTLTLLNAIAADSECVEMALKKDTLRFQGDTIEILTQQREKFVKDLYGEKRRTLGGVDKTAF